jgi:hypothetical protein
MAYNGLSRFDNHLGQAGKCPFAFGSASGSS